VTVFEIPRTFLKRLRDILDPELRCVRYFMARVELHVNLRSCLSAHKNTYRSVYIYFRQGVSRFADGCPPKSCVAAPVYPSLLQSTDSPCTVSGSLSRLVSASNFHGYFRATDWSGGNGQPKSHPLICWYAPRRTDGETLHSVPSSSRSRCRPCESRQFRND
jgi:hypothetical protein